MSGALQVTAFIAVPAIMADIIRTARSTPAVQGGVVLPSVQTVLVGGGPLQASLAAQLPTTFPRARITTAYGMTEACSSMTFQPLHCGPPQARAARMLGITHSCAT